MAGSGIDEQAGSGPTTARGALSRAPRPWAVAPELPLSQLDALAPGLTRLQVQLLANRGWRGEAARDFLQADWHAQPPRLLGIDAAVARLWRAAEHGERVVVFGDFDADGLTSCAVMLLALRAIGVAAEPYIPGREAEGRGPSESAMEQLAAAGARLIVTTDCGTTNVAAAELAARLGVDLVITDHHPPQGPLAPAVAIVNPQQPGCPSAGTGHLAGVGVAFRVAEALLAQQPAPTRQQTLEALLDLVAIGTVGDVAPITPENWRLVRAGLLRLNTHPRVGLRTLVDRAGLRLGALTERDIGFALAPRLNAAGRMGSPLVALELLTTADPAVAGDLARQLQQLNEERQRATDAVLALARAQVLAQVHTGETILVASGEGWPLGVTGLVASRLVDDYARPVLIASLSAVECRGSLRGPVGLNLVETLAQRAELLRHFGGHAQAAGFTIARGDLDTLTAHLRAAMRLLAVRTAGAPPPDAAPIPVQAPVAGPAPSLVDVPAGLIADVAEAAVVAVGSELFDGVPTAAAPVALVSLDVDPVQVDCRLPLRRVTAETYQAIRLLAPFGPGFAEPVFCATGVRIVRTWRSGPEGRTLRLLLRDGTTQRTAFWSRQGALQSALHDLGQVDLAYTIDRFTRPDTAPEPVLRIIALRPAAAPLAAPAAPRSPLPQAP